MTTENRKIAEEIVQIAQGTAERFDDIRDIIEAALDEKDAKIERRRQSQEHYVTELHQRISILEGKTGFFTNNMAGMVGNNG